MNISEANRMDRTEFVRAFGAIFEHSPWVAERTFDARPFAGHGELHAAMVAAVEAATREEQLALLRAHPDLAGKEAQEGSMTDSSVDEQASVGLDRLSKAEMGAIAELNAAYRGKHGFPFIIAVRHFTKAQIFDEFVRRLANASEAERCAGLQQVYTITGLRLARLFEGGAAPASIAPLAA